jgi:hypothetical protein
MTVDTSHVVVTGSTTRENFYVAMTRGRESNIAYVALDRPDDSHSAPSPDEVTAKTILFGVLQHSGVELSAHQTIDAEHDHWSSFAQITAEYLTIAAEAQHDRWVAELQAAGLDAEQVAAIVTSDSFGPLAAELRRAEATGHDIATALPRIVTQRSLNNAADIGALLINRSAMRRMPRLIAGQIPVADGPCQMRCTPRSPNARRCWRNGRPQLLRLQLRTESAGLGSSATRREIRTNAKPGCRRSALWPRTATCTTSTATHQSVRTVRQTGSE